MAAIVAFLNSPWYSRVSVQTSLSLFATHSLSLSLPHSYFLEQNRNESARFDEKSSPHHHLYQLYDAALRALPHSVLCLTSVLTDQKKAYIAVSRDWSCLSSDTHHTETGRLNALLTSRACPLIPQKNRESVPLHTSVLCVVLVLSKLSTLDCSSISLSHSLSLSLSQRARLVQASRSFSHSHTHTHSLFLPSFHLYFPLLTTPFPEPVRQQRINARASFVLHSPSPPSPLFSLFFFLSCLSRAPSSSSSFPFSFSFSGDFPGQSSRRQRVCVL